MKLNNKLLSLFLLINLLLITYGDINNNTFGLNKGRQTKSYPKAMFDAQAYYDAALKGELQTAKKEPFLLSSLKRVGIKPSGKAIGGIYEDKDGEIWIVKYGQAPIDEYLGSKIMDLLIGPFSPEVKVLIDAPGYTASKFLPGFLTEKEAKRNPKHNHKPIVGKEKLLIAMDLMGLEDRHEENMGYIDLGDQLEAARVDFDSAFSFHYLHPFDYNDVKAIKSIADIPDEMFLYVLGDAYNDLWEASIHVQPIRIKYKKNLYDLGLILIARKNELKNYPELYALYDKAKNNSSFFTSEDFERLSQLIATLTVYGTPLNLAINNNETDLINLFLSKDPNVNDPDFSGNTPLILATEKDNLELVRLLLDKGADVNARNDKSNTALLSIKIRTAKPEIAHLLLDNGADVNLADNRGNTPLLFAAEYGNLELFRLLLDKGANVNIKNSSGNTPLLLAVARNKPAIVHLLLDKGVDVNAKNSLNYTPLLLAVRNGNLEIVRLLLDNGADMNVKNDWDQTPLDIAEMKSMTEIVDLLREKMQTAENG